HPEVRDSGLDPWQHYLEKGYVAGNKPSDAPQHPNWFDPEFYLSHYPEVRASGLDPWQHFIGYGYLEKRRPSMQEGLYDFDGLATIHNADFMQNPDFIKAYDRGSQAARGIDHHWYWRFHVGLWCIRTAMALPGDFVEFGVNYGMLASGGMLDVDWNKRNKTFFLFDSFAGMKPEHIESSEKGRDHLSEYNSTSLSNEFYATSADEVRANFAEFKNIEIIVGFIPDTLDQLTSSRLAFVHIDLNNPAPEVDALRYVWDQIVPGGIVLLDDYAQNGFELQKEAMDTLSQELSFHILALPTGQGMILKT
ncbi:TylF/MycF/NovP-related O-methyltransferase, partial [Aliiruegeria lutimaris]